MIEVSSQQVVSELFEGEKYCSTLSCIALYCHSGDDSERLAYEMTSLRAVKASIHSVFHSNGVAFVVSLFRGADMSAKF